MPATIGPFELEYTEVTLDSMDIRKVMSDNAIKDAARYLAIRWPIFQPLDEFYWPYWCFNEMQFGYRNAGRDPITLIPADEELVIPSYVSSIDNGNSTLEIINFDRSYRLLRPRPEFAIRVPYTLVSEYLGTEPLIYQVKSNYPLSLFETDQFLYGIKEQTTVFNTSPAYQFLAYHYRQAIQRFEEIAEPHWLMRALGAGPAVDLHGVDYAKKDGSWTVTYQGTPPIR